MTDLVIGVTAGSFDLTHAGHYLMIEECKGQCDYLIVFLQTNPHIDRPDKNTPVQSTHERYLQVRACKYIDEVIVYETEADLYNLLCSVKFDKRFIGSDWEGKPYTGHNIPGMISKVVFNSRNHGFSTSNLRKRVYEAENAKHTDTKKRTTTGSNS
jgi:glycerol-3-phosphate cytidylyltransferase